MGTLGLVAYSTTSLVFIAVAAFIAGLARGFSGFGSALIFIPLASSIVGAKVASPLLLLIDFATSLPLIPNAVRHADKRDVGIISLGALIGVPIGTAALAFADPLAVRWGIAALILLLLLLLASGWRYPGRPTIPVTVSVGTLAGFFGGLAQLGGPPVVLYWLRDAAVAAVVRANIILYFAIADVLITISYSVGGLWSTAILGLAVITGPLFGLGLWIGSKLFGKASDELFRRICYALIAVSAVIGLPLFDGLFR
ncbi:sulfite exporter TauE/SafE family protein [Rhodopseudomonas boonkerdii]|nr:sulfite exporter TauE/SafE family protein [Rhodopseudomonas boonkerdii]